MLPFRTVCAGNGSSSRSQSEIGKTISALMRRKLAQRLRDRPNMLAPTAASSAKAAVAPAPSNPGTVHQPAKAWLLSVQPNNVLITANFNVAHDDLPMTQRCLTQIQRTLPRKL